ncbi:MAG TPA: hypothetical protein PKJ99_09565 [Thermoanaerobaculales bacterium]|nr:hypothetical protein [Thermoanaerobaculales bacterium]
MPHSELRTACPAGDRRCPIEYIEGRRSFSRLRDIILLILVVGVLGAALPSVRAADAHPEYADAVGVKVWDYLFQEVPDDAFDIVFGAGASTVLISVTWRELHEQYYNKETRCYEHRLNPDLLAEPDRGVALALDAGLEVVLSLGRQRAHLGDGP